MSTGLTHVLRMSVSQTVCVADNSVYNVWMSSAEQDEHLAFYEEVGRRIRDARKGRKPALTQDGLAKLVGLTRTSITNVEQGRQKCLLHTFAEIATALHVEAATLIPIAGVQTTDLDTALEGRDASEQKWIKMTVGPSSNGRGKHGS